MGIPAPMALPHVAQARMIEEPVVAKAQVVHPIPAPQPVATPVKKVFMPAPSSSTKKVVPQIAVHRAKVHQLPAFPPLAAAAAAADISASPMLSSDLHSSMSSFASASSNISDQDDSLADTHGMSSSSFTTSLDTLSDTRSPPSPTPPVLPPPPVSSSGALPPGGAPPPSPPPGGLPAHVRSHSGNRKRRLSFSSRRLSPRLPRRPSIPTQAPPELTSSSLWSSSDDNDDNDNRDDHGDGSSSSLGSLPFGGWYGGDTDGERATSSFSRVSGVSAKSALDMTLESVSRALEPAPYSIAGIRRSSISGGRPSPLSPSGASSPLFRQRALASSHAAINPLSNLSVDGPSRSPRSNLAFPPSDLAALSSPNVHYADLSSDGDDEDLSPH